MVMLGGNCSPCCCGGPCPDYSVFESAETLYASVTYTYGISSPQAPLVRTNSFSGLYALPKNANGWDSARIQDDGVGSWQLRVRLIQDSLGNKIGLRFLCLRLADNDFLTIGSFGSIGFDEIPCGGDPPVAQAIGRYAIASQFFFGSGAGPHIYTYQRDGRLALFGEYDNTSIFDPFHNVTIGTPPLHKLANACSNETASGFISDSPPPPQTIEYFYYNKEGNDEYIVSELLEVVALEADFGSFAQNMLMSVCNRYWDNKIGTADEVKIQLGDAEISESFTSQSTRCTQITP